MEDAARLQALYPGNNATQIAQQQTVVLSSWTALQDRSAQRREELQASCDLQRFLTQVSSSVLFLCHKFEKIINANHFMYLLLSVKVRDLLSWASGLRAAMLTEEKVRDAAGAQTLKAEHEAVKAEIEAREDNFKTVLELGEAMIQGKHYASQVGRHAIFVLFH